MATKKLFFLFSVLLSMVGTKTWAYDISVKNAEGVTIYYNYISDGKELEVTFEFEGYASSDYIYAFYSGSVVIPDEVTYMNRTRKVTSIGEKAFLKCDYLASVSIPSSVSSIGKEAFRKCSGLTSVTIGSGVTSIGEYAFEGCSGLTSVTIPSSVTSTSIGEYAFSGCSGLTSVTIGSSVTSIGNHAFYECSGLTSVHITDIAAWCKIVFNDAFGNPLFYAHHLYLNGEEIKDLVIPNSVTSIGERAFYECSSLTSVSIGNRVTSIGYDAFRKCSGLTSVHITDIDAWCKITFGYNAESNPLYYAHHLYLNGEEIKDLVIPNSVTSLGNNAFSGCSGLTSVTIGSSVTSIGESAFYLCSGLTSVTIPNSVTSIGWEAFGGSGPLEVISKIENPFPISYYTFSDNTFYNATLYVPKGTIDKYKATEGWERFVFIEEGAGGGEEENGGGETPETKKCEKPTITFKDGKLVFSCATEGVSYQYNITASSVSSGTGNNINFTPKYTITAYATKDGYDDSDTATLEVSASDTANGDMNGDGVIDAADITIIVNIIMEQNE